MDAETWDEIQKFRAATKNLENKPINEGGSWVGGLHVPKGCTYDNGKVYL